MRAFRNLALVWAIAVLVAAVSVAPVQAADRAKLKDFLKITGFDVALDSIRLSAETAPQTLGMEADDFGYMWTQMVDEVFVPALMHDMALDILGETLDDDHLDHAVGFYTSDLGARLVAVENRSHMSEDDELKSESGEAIVAGLVRIGSPRVEILKRMSNASDPANNGLRAIQEVQIRFLMAAAGAGVIELQMDEADLRAAFQSSEAETRLLMQASALAGSAYTYQAFSDAEVEAYSQALEHEKMRHVYDLMNIVHFEVMADRFEALAARMKGFQPAEEL